MKGTMKKVISMMQLLIIVLTITISPIAILCEKAIASESEKNLINSPGFIDAPWVTDLSNNIKILTTATEDSFSCNSRDENHFYIDQGVTFNIELTDRLKQITHYTTYVYEGKVINGYPNDYLRAYIKEAQINLNDFETDDNGKDLYTIVTTGLQPGIFGSYEKEIGRAYIELRRYSIWLSEKNSGIDFNNQICDNALLSNNVLYVAPGSEVYVAARRAGGKDASAVNYTYTITNGLGSIDGDKLKINSTAVLGQEGVLTFSNENNTTCSIKVVVSNLASKDVIIKNKYNTSIEKFNEDKIKITTSKKGSVIEVHQSPCYEDGKIVLSDLEISDTSSCIKDVNIKKASDHYIVSFTAVKNGIIDINYKDYQGNQTQKVDIVCVDGDIKQSDGDGDGDGDGDDEVLPTISYTKNEPSNGTVKLNVTTQNATHVKYLITESSTQDYINPVKPNSRYSDYTTTNGWKEVSAPAEFTVQMNTSKANSGKYYSLTILAKNEKDELIVTKEIYPIIEREREENTTKPTVTTTSAEKDVDGIITANFTIKDVTHVKYLIKERTTENYVSPISKNSSYSDYTSDKGWKEVGTPNKFSIKLNPYQLGSGKYDIVVLAKNNSDTAITEVAYGAHFINAEPVCGIMEQTQNSTSTLRKYYIYSTSPDSDNINSWCYVQYKTSQSNYTTPSVETIKSQGKKFTGSTELKLDMENNYESGLYDVTVYVEDEHGASDMSKISNIGITNTPTIKYQIIGENGDSEAGYTYASNMKDKHTINVQLNDIDENNNLRVWYYISENPDIDISNLTSFYMNGENIVYKKFDGNTGNLDIEISEEQEKQSSKYVYIMVQDNVGAYKILRTGEIKLDGTPLKMISIYSDKKMDDTEIKGVCIGEELKVQCTFNHDMKESFPDLYIKFGDTERKQDSVECEGSVITYIYSINKKDANGYVSVSRFDYSENKFMDNYSISNIYDKQIGEDKVINVIGTNQIYVDTKVPEIESIEIQYTTNQNSNIIDRSSDNIKYVSGVDNIQCKVTYSEEMVGEPVTMFFEKGGKYIFQVTGEYESDSVKNVHVYNFTKEHNTNASVYDGNYGVYGFAFNLNLTDKAGNKPILQNYDIKYTLNDKDLGDTKIIFDDIVYEGKVEVNDAIVKNNAVCNINSEVLCFAEYKNGNEQDFKDSSEMQSIKIGIFKGENSEGIVLKDKKGQEIEKNIEEEKYQYELTKEQLPVTFITEESEVYTVVLGKEDNLGNTSEEIIQLDSKEFVKKSEESGLTNFNKDEMYNYYIITSDEYDNNNKNIKEYELLFKLEGIEVSEIDAILMDNDGKKLNIEYTGQVVKNNVMYESYKFDITRAQEYSLTFKNKEDGVVVYNELLKLDNIYTPGDANGDGMITSIDATLILKYIAGYKSDKKVAKAGDINNDGRVKIDDVILLNRLIAEDKLTSLGNGYYGK